MNKKITFLILFLFIFKNIYCQIVEEGNIARYYFSEANANDVIGDNDGVIFGAVPAADRCGNDENAFQFNNSFIRIDHDEILDLGSNEFSISAWFKTEDNDSYGVIFNKGEGSGSKPRIFIRTMESPINTFQWRVGDGISNITVSYTDTSFFDNKWHHVVLVRNTNDLSFYLDGSLVDLTSSNQLPSINTNSDRPILIGVQDSILNSNIPFGNYFDGRLDDYRIYNRAINDLEVDSLFNEEKPIINSTASLNFYNILISPNPFLDNINIDLPSSISDEVHFEIFNNSGSVVKSGLLANSKIDLAALDSGIYYLKLIHQRSIIGIEKLIKIED